MYNSKDFDNSTYIIVLLLLNIGTYILLLKYVYLIISKYNMESRDVF